MSSNINDRIINHEQIEKIKAENKNLKSENKELRAALIKAQKISFSKIALMLVLSMYFLGVFLGVFIIIRILLITPEYSVEAFVALLTYIGAPTSVCIGFYSWKAKCENTLKISHSHDENGNNENDNNETGEQ